MHKTCFALKNVRQNLFYMQKKGRLKKYLARRFFIRFHMSIILTATILVGLLSTKILSAANVESVVLRYPTVVIISYFAFFFFIRLWLMYIKYRDKIIENAADLIDVPFDAQSSQPGFSRQDSIECGSGEFGGAGASGSFEIPSGGVLQEGSSSIAEAAGETSASILEEGAVILIPLMLIFALIFGAGIFLIYEAPLILTEAAFEFVLAGALFKKAKEIDNPDWIGSVFKNTWVPFALTLLLSVMGALLLSHMFPEATNLSEIFSK